MNNSENSSDFLHYKTKPELHMAKDKLKQKSDTKIDLFEKCLNEVGLYRSFPFLDPTNYRLLAKILPSSIQTVPIDKTEELLMRNCVKRNLYQIKQIKELSN